MDPQLLKLHDEQQVEEGCYKPLLDIRVDNPKVIHPVNKKKLSSSFPIVKKYDIARMDEVFFNINSETSMWDCHFIVQVYKILLNDVIKGKFENDNFHFYTTQKLLSSRSEF